MRQLSQRVRLIHKLRQLRTAEEFAHSRHHGPYVYQRRRRGCGRIYLRTHPLFDNALHTHKPHADLVLYQLAHRAHAPVAQVVDVVGRYHAVVDKDHMPYQLYDVLRLQHAQLGVGFPAQAAVELMPPHAPKIVAAAVVEQRLYQRARVIQAGRLAGPQPAIELHQRVVLRQNAGVPIYSGADELVVVVGVHILKEIQYLRIGGVSHSAQQRADGRLALAVDLDRNEVAVAGFELHPSAAIGYQFGGGKPPARVGVRLGGEIHARRAHKLAHHHALSAVYDERPGVGHHRDVAHKERLLLDLAAGVARRGVFQADGHIQRRGVGDLVLAALFFAELGLFEVVVAQRKLEPLARGVLYGRNLVEQLAQPVRHKPVEGIALNLYQVGHLPHRLSGGIRMARRVRGVAIAVAVGDAAVAAAVFGCLVKRLRNSGCGHALTLLYKEMIG